jgi:hypothetical protein
MSLIDSFNQHFKILLNDIAKDLFLPAGNLCPEQTP